MALVSPGVEVSIIDESTYLPAATNSIPYILIATAQNKINGAGTAVAAGTTAANANKVYLISSQRDLVNTFGNPFFYKTTTGTSIHGYELNEYGLLAAYSVLGVSNRAFVQRVDVDMSQLVATLARPTGSPDDGDYWLDTATSGWGIFEWDSSNNSFTAQTPRVITSTDDLDTGIPKTSIGSIGDYAVVATNANNPVYFKTPGMTEAGVSANEWVLVGGDEWKVSWPTIQSSVTNPTLTSTDEIAINGTAINLSSTTISSLASDINAAAITGVYAAVVNNKLEIYADSTATNDGSTANGGIIAIEDLTGNCLSDLGLVTGEYLAPGLQQSAHYSVPTWKSVQATPRPTGSVWNKTTSVNNGAEIVIKKFSATLGLFIQQSCPLYENDQTANKNIDAAGGGKNIVAGATYAQYDVNEDDTATVKIFSRLASGATIVTGSDVAPSFTNGNTFTIKASTANSSVLTAAVTATVSGTNAAAFVSAVTAANVPNVTASVTAEGAIQIAHTLGGVIVLTNATGSPLADAGITTDLDGVRAGNNNDLILSNWVALTYDAKANLPSQNPAEGRKWYYSTASAPDVMIKDNGNWVGYKTVASDVRGFALTATDPAGPQISPTAPIAQSDETDLVHGDLWIDTSDLENYPSIKRWADVDGVDQWVSVDNTDQTTENGILFADARWGTSGAVDPIIDDFPTIKALLSSSYLDVDAPDSALYPDGTLLWNTRRSGYNVKEFRNNYFNAIDFPNTVLPTVKDAWVSVSGLKDDGSMFAGRKAVRQMVVAALKAGIDTNTEIREEQRQFNLLACPNYPELIPNMVALNNDRNNTGFVVGDSPLRLSDNATELLAWATNAKNAGTGENGLATSDPYLGVFYPACQTNDLTGATVVQPASHMMLRTIIRNDEIGFPWLAPAGTRRGVVDNASNIGYIDATTGEFQPTALRQSIRDVLYENAVNPITFLPGAGILNYGNKTTTVASALDRINVARLVAYVRGRLEFISKQFLFEPNDKITRDELKGQCESLLNELVAKRGVYDYLVVCDETNNTPARVDRNELYVDIAIEPTKAVEFIYIPVRIKNTGEIAAGG